MLHFLIFSFFLLFSFATSGAIAEKNKDHQSSSLMQPSHSWIKEINSKAEELINLHQKDARAIVDHITHPILQSQHCPTLQEIAHKGKNIAQEFLQQNQGKENAIYPTLLVFISFSMPIEGLKTLGKQVNQLGGKLVLRGLLEGSFKKTIAKLKEIQEEIIIDPTLFEVFNINVVPTFIFRQKVSEISHEAGLYDRLQGNVSLNFALEQFASSGNQEAVQLLQILRRKP